MEEAVIRKLASFGALIVVSVNDALTYYAFPICVGAIAIARDFFMTAMLTGMALAISISAIITHLELFIFFNKNRNRLEKYRKLKFRKKVRYIRKIECNVLRV